MEIRVLRYFLAVAREGTISGAAEYLHLSQPSLSRQLMELEEEVGKKLFIRGNRKITLTQEGELLRRRAGEIITLLEKTENELRDASEDVRGDLFIGGGETKAMHFIAETAKQVQDSYPHICYHLFSGNSDDVKERLDKGLLDFGILIEPFDRNKYDSIKLPATDTWGVLMRKDSPLASREVIMPEDIWDFPLILSRQAITMETQLGWIGKDALNIVGTYNLIHNAALLVEAGLGYALCLDKLIYTSGDSMLCFRPLYPAQTVTMDIVWKKYQVFSKAAGKFLEQIQQSVKDAAVQK